MLYTSGGKGGQGENLKGCPLPSPAAKESSELAKQLLADSVQREGVEPGSLTIHADLCRPSDYADGRYCL